MSGVQGATLDSIGQVYFASALGIQMCEANGRVAAILKFARNPALSLTRVRREGCELALCGRRRQLLSSPRRESEWSGGVGSGEVAARRRFSQATRASPFARPNLTRPMRLAPGVLVGRPPIAAVRHPVHSSHSTTTR